MQPGDEREPRLDRRRSVSGAAMSSSSRRRPGGGLAAVDFGEQAAGDLPDTDRVSSRLSRVAGVDRHVARPRGSAAAVEQDAGALLRRVEIGEQASRRGQLGPRRRAEAVERRHAERP